MTVCVDNMHRRATVGRFTANWSHVFADSSAELAAFARRLGLRLAWLQHAGTHREHYDVTDSVRRRALVLGARPITYPTDVAALVSARRSVCCCSHLDECRWGDLEASTPAPERRNRAMTPNRAAPDRSDAPGRFSPRPPRAPDRMTTTQDIQLSVSYAYTRRQGEFSNGAEHYITNQAIHVGRLHREAGDALCRPQRTFWGLDPRPERTDATCKRCIEIAGRLSNA